MNDTDIQCSFKMPFMTRQQLKQKLDDLEIDPAFYSLDGNGAPGQMVLVQDEQAWNVFYFDLEDGRTNLRTFASESDACNYLYRFYQLR